MMRTAVLTIDVEDWYHLDYFNRHDCNNSITMLDGLDVFAKIIEERKIRASYFVLGEIAEKLGSHLRYQAASGNNINSHGWNHLRPLTIGIREFRDDLIRSRETIMDIIEKPVLGYRAPCFSIDRERLDIVCEVGYKFDSSKIDFGLHPLYGSIDMTGFSEIKGGIFMKGDFVEFEIGTFKVLDKKVPVCGGGYIRIIPWLLLKRWIRRFVEDGGTYILYIHPFELSLRKVPCFPQSTGLISRFRFGYGRSKVRDRINALLDILGELGCRIITLDDLRSEILLEGVRDF